MKLNDNYTYSSGWVTKGVASLSKYDDLAISRQPGKKYAIIGGVIKSKYPLANILLGD